MVTIFLCTWVVIHPRVYRRELYATLHKVALFLKAILAPELIAVEALQEWAQCRRMVEECATLTGGQFELVHAFYVSMLALRHRTPQGDRVIWPNQYTWLLRQKLVRWEDQADWGLSLERIRDQSKAESAAKFLTLIQVCWFVAQSIMRTAHGLPLSQLESMTLSYIPLFAVTYFFWWYKPKDIRTPSIVTLPPMSEEQASIFESMAVSNKFDDEGMEDQVTYWNIWYLTPRVFEKDAEDEALRAWKQAAENHEQRGIERTTTDGQASPEITGESNVDNAQYQHSEFEVSTLPKEIVLSHWDPDLYGSRIWPAACFFGASFGALHLVAWNTVFPTNVELWLWRTASFVSIISMVIFMHFRRVVLRWGGPLTIISLVSPVFYLASRIVMMAQVFAALRAEDPGIYDTYQVSTYLIHFL